jgi:protein-L-isoaspartate(D-aspartate) O-methyltransferase
MNPSEPKRMLATIAEQFARTAARTGAAAARPGVLEAMAAVPRERFVPAGSKHRAYDDAALALACGQTISQPFMVALMTSLLHPQAHHRLLEIGTGSGYQAAVLGELVHEVHTLEVVPELAASAAERLRMLGYDNVHVHDADGTGGWPERAPYDGILVACGSESIPLSLVEQLAPHGHLVIPIGMRDDQRLFDVTKDTSGTAHPRDVLGVRFVPFVRVPPPRHERFDDPRGIGIRAIAATAAQAFAELAAALSALVADPAQVRPERRVEFACSAANGKQLLARWLDEVAWAMQRQELVFHRFEVRLRGDSLRATGDGERLDPTRHRPGTALGTLALLDAHLDHTAEGWHARCIASSAR